MRLFTKLSKLCFILIVIYLMIFMLTDSDKKWSKLTLKKMIKEISFNSGFIVFHKNINSELRIRAIEPSNSSDFTIHKFISDKNK